MEGSWKGLSRDPSGAKVPPCKAPLTVGLIRVSGAERGAGFSHNGDVAVTLALCAHQHLPRVVWVLQSSCHVEVIPKMNVFGDACYYHDVLSWSRESAVWTITLNM